MGNIKKWILLDGAKGFASTFFSEKVKEIYFGIGEFLRMVKGSGFG